MALRKSIKVLIFIVDVFVLSLLVFCLSPRGELYSNILKRSNIKIRAFTMRP